MNRPSPLPILASTWLPLLILAPSFPALAQTPPAPPTAAPSAAPAPQPNANPPIINFPSVSGQNNAAPLPGGGKTNAATPAAGDPSMAAPGSQFDNRLPAVDPTSGIIRFNGQTWDIANNAIVAARFEKYLNTPEELSDAERDHRAILNKIILLLDPSNLNQQTLSDAYRLLNRAAAFPGDARLCDSLSNAIYSVWQSKRNQGILVEANKILEEERKYARRNFETKVGTPSFDSKGSAPAPASRPPSSPGPTTTGGVGQSSRISVPNDFSPLNPASAAGGKEGQAQGEAGQQLASFSKAGAYQETVIGNAVKIKANEAKAALSEIQSKIEFQSLLVQLFLQRRFHHLVIGTKFYRALFTDGDSKLNLPDKTKQLFGSTGSPPTISTLETLGNEAMRDVQTSVQAFHSLVDAGELDSASRRLREAFLIGEYMPEIRTLPKERKRKILAYAQKSVQLLAAIETKDYGLANELITGENGMKSMAKDFDATKPMAMIETARNMSRMHLAKARNAALSGEKDKFEASLAEAGQIWPNNPELAEVASKAFKQGDAQAQALNDLEQLIAQKNFRRIADEAGRFLAATQMAPQEKQAQLKTILEDFKSLEAALMGAKEMERLGNASGAWETLERVAEKFPDDLQLAQARATYTTKAAEFVRAVQNAQEHERHAQLATGLAWFLKAQKLYPKSEMAENAIQRIKTQLLPEASQ